MRQFILGSFEKLVWLLVFILLIGSVIGGLGTMFSGSGPGILVGLAVMIGGVIYAIVIGGILLLFVGIHDNTKRSAEALERMSKLG